MTELKLNISHAPFCHQYDMNYLTYHYYSSFLFSQSFFREDDRFPDIFQATFVKFDPALKIL
jgi:hypothetical protein